ncbi:MAG: tRNA (N(6)-L-threonylcarbamoyladenosine(37)-C(2))-methylthiotransferase MtaB [Crenarchaeota archaeon]|nr:tRNA (N(6)-L-threonylcarbamoyladenosine(37)-C(2))-methylthiotransferase MtaB [Thermoproteota archaeon]
MPIKITTFGCRLNTYESEVIKTFFKDCEDIKEKEIVIFNSCAVTSEAEKQLRQAIRKTKKENPNTIIGVVGCAVQVNPEIYRKMPEVSFIFGNREKMNRENYNNLGLEKNEKNIIVGNIFELTNLSPQFITGFEERTRAFIQIQNGCDNFCTFCATRLARGKSSSIPSKNIIEQINKLIENNYNEIVLTGVDIADYGRRLDENINLGKLIKKILSETDLKRLRLSSIDIADVNEDLKEVLFNENRLMPHIHISLQSGDNDILKKMNRRHTREEVINFCNEIRKHRNNLSIGADLIAGFPTETEEMHRNSLNLIDEINLTFGHIFPYSIREGTVAAKMPQIDMNIRRLRAKELRESAENQLKKFIKKQRDKKHRILIENDSIGRTENYLMVKLNKNIFKKNKIGDIFELIVDEKDFIIRSN